MPKRHKHDKSLNSNVAISYKTLLEKSLEDDIFSSPPSIDNTGSPSTIDVAGATSNGDTLTTKLLEQAEEFENTSSRRNSLSLNEMIKTTMNGKPIPTKRRQGSALSFTKQGKEASTIFIIWWSSTRFHLHEIYDLTKDMFTERYDLTKYRLCMYCANTK